MFATNGVRNTPLYVTHLYFCAVFLMETDFKAFYHHFYISMYQSCLFKKNFVMYPSFRSMSKSILNIILEPNVRAIVFRIDFNLLNLTPPPFFEILQKCQIVETSERFLNIRFSIKDCPLKLWLVFYCHDTRWNRGILDYHFSQLVAVKSRY